jgi:hypothetical protein
MSKTDDPELIQTQKHQATPWLPKVSARPKAITLLEPACLHGWQTSTIDTYRLQQIVQMVHSCHTSALDVCKPYSCLRSRSCSCIGSHVVGPLVEPQRVQGDSRVNTMFGHIPALGVDLILRVFLHAPGLPTLTCFPSLTCIPCSPLPHLAAGTLDVNLISCVVLYTTLLQAR